MFNVGDSCEALLHGSWLTSRVTRCAIGGREYDIELDDGTELEDVEASRLRPLSRRRRNDEDWTCLERLAIDAYERRGSVGRKPQLSSCCREQDQLRRLELLLHREDLKRMRDAYREIGRGDELDVDDTVSAFEMLNRKASKANVLAFLSKKSRKSLDFLSFCKCLAALFHGEDTPPHLLGSHNATPRQEDAKDVSMWAKALGKAQLLQIETTFRKRCIPYSSRDGTTRLGLPLSHVRAVFRDLGHDLTPSKLSAILRGLDSADCLTFVEFVALFHSAFGERPETTAVVTRNETVLEDGALRPIAEIAAVVFAEEPWEATQSQHDSLVARLSVGRDVKVRALIQRARDEFENQDRDRTGRLDPSCAQAVLAKLDVNPSSGHVRDAARRLFTSRETKASSTVGVSLPEFFALAGPLIEAASEARSTVASAFARLRLKSPTPCDVRAAGDLAAKYLSNILAAPRERHRQRVAIDNEIFQARIGRLDGGIQLMKSIGFVKRVIDKNRREWLVMPSTSAVKARLLDVRAELGSSHLGTISAAIRNIRASPAALRDALDLAHKCVTNILKHPHDPRVYRIRVANPLMQTKILGLPNGMQLANAIGFVQNGQHLELRHRKTSTFTFPKLDAETESFLYGIVADLDDARRALSRPADPIRTIQTATPRTKKKSSVVKNTRGPSSELERMLSRGTSVQRAQLGMARDAFSAYDRDGDGILSREDVRLAFQALGRSDVDKWIGRHDLDKDGVVSFADFLASIAPMIQVTASHKERAAPSPTSDIAGSIGTLRLAASLGQVKDIVSCVQSCVERVLNAPANSQYWRIRVDNPDFKKRVGNYAGGISLLVACGFSLEENGSVLALRDGANGERWDRVPANVLGKLGRVRDELRGRLVALEHPEVADVAAISSAKVSNEMMPVVDLCRKYVKNAIENPKLRTISTESKVFRDKVLKTPEGLELFVAIGWREVPGGGAFYLPKALTKDLLQARLLELQVCLDEHKNNDCKEDEPAPPPAQKQQNVARKPSSELHVARTLLSRAETAKQRAESEARTARRRAESLAAELQKAKSEQQRQQFRRSPSEEKTARPASMRLGYYPASSRGPRTVGKDIVKGVTAQLVDRAHAGTNELRICVGGKAWRVGNKARVGTADRFEERFICEIRDDLLLLNKPLTFGHSSGTWVNMVKPSTDERRFFRRNRLLRFVRHGILGDIVDVATRQGEAIVQARIAQAEFERRSVPRSLFIAQPVFTRHSSKLLGALPKAGTLMLRESDETMTCFTEAFTLSDLMRLFDRINSSDTGRISQHELNVARTEDQEVSALFQNEQTGDDLTFMDDFVFRFLDKVDLIPLPDSSCSTISDDDLLEIALVFSFFARDDRLPTASLPAAFSELEGCFPEQEAEEWPPAFRESFKSGRSLTLVEFIHLRELHVRQLGVPVGPDGKYRGAGINGWRRHALRSIRREWHFTLSEAAKATGKHLDAAPGYDLYHRICSSESTGAFLMLHTRHMTSLRDDLHQTIISNNPDEEAETHLTWRMVEALVYAHSSAVPRTALAKQRKGRNEIFRTGPAVMVDEMRATAENGRVRVVHETVVDTSRSRLFLLSDDGMLEIWDATAHRLCDPSPLRLITTKHQQSQVSLVVQMLSLKPRCQSLFLCDDARQLIVNTTAGDGCIRFHEVNTFTELARVRLSGIRDYPGGYLFDQVREGVVDGSSRGAVSSFAFIPEEELIFVSLVGDAVFRSHCSRTGDLVALMPGHTGAVGPITYLPGQLQLVVTGSTDCSVRLWDVRSSKVPADKSEGCPLARSKQALESALSAIGPHPGWRNGTIIAVIDSTLLGLPDDPIIEVEYDDDQTIDFVHPKKLHQRSESHPLVDSGRLARKVKNRSELSPSVAISAGTQVAVWHDRQRQSIKRLFSRFPSIGHNRVGYADFISVFLELSDTYSSEGLSQDDAWRVAHSLDPKGRGYVTYEAFELLLFVRRRMCQGEQLQYVPARRVLRGHSAPVCTLAFLPHTSLLASAAADGTVRIWDPCHVQHNLVLPSHVHHLRTMPGYYYPTPDDWTSPSAAPVVLRLVDAATASTQHQKLTATSLQSVSLKTRSTRSRISAPPEAIAAALAFDVAPDMVRGLLYLLEDGTVLPLAIDSFDTRLLTLAVEDAGHFLHFGPDFAMRQVIFSERHRILRVGFVASTAFHSLDMIVGALDTHRDQNDVHPLAMPGGGDAKVLLALQIHLVLFAQESDSIEKDVRHLLVGKGDCATNDAKTECELLLAELTSGSTSVVVAWAVERATFMMNVNRTHCDLFEGELKELRAGAIHSAVVSWRHALHIYRSSIADERKGETDIVCATRHALQEYSKAGIRVLVEPGDGHEEAKKWFTRSAALSSVPSSNEIFLKSAFCLGLAFHRIVSRTGNPLVSSETLISELRSVAHTLRFDIRYVCLEALGAMPTLTLDKACRIMKLNQATSVAAPTVFFAHRPLLGELAYKTWQQVVDERTQICSLRESGWSRNVDCIPFFQACDFSCLGFDATCSTLSARARDAPLSRDTELTWLQRWACLVECERWIDQIRLARKEVWAATHPLTKRVDQLLLSRREKTYVDSVASSYSIGASARRTSHLVSVDDCRLDGAASSVAEAFGCTLESQAKVEQALCFRLRGTFNEEILARLTNISSELAHENLAPVLFVDDAGFSFFGIREEIVTTLRHVLSVHGGVGFDNRGVLIARLWLEQLCRGLAHMHARGLVCRTLRAEHVIVSSDGLRIVPLLPAEFGCKAGSRCEPLPTNELFRPDDILTPPEAIEVSMVSGSLSFEIVDDDDGPSHAWDSWSLAVLLCELIFSTKPESWATQLDQYFHSQRRFLQSGTMCNNESATAAIREAARSLHFDIIPTTALSSLAALKRGRQHMLMKSDQREGDIRDVLRANVSVLASEARLRGDSFSSSRILQRLREDTELSEELVRKVLVDEFRFILDDDDDIKAIVENFDEIKDAFVVEEDSHLLATLAACFEPDPTVRITTTSLLSDRESVLSTMEAAEARLEVDAYLAGALPKSSYWYQRYVTEPLARLERRDEGNGDEFELFVNVARTATRMVRGDFDDDDFERVMRDEIAERCVALTTFYENNAGPVYPLILELLRRVCHDDNYSERVVAIATRVLTLPDATAVSPARGDKQQVVVVEKVLELYGEIAPHDYLRSLVSASRALQDSTSTDGGRAGRRGAAKALAMLCKNEDAARALLDADVPSRLLPLTGDRWCCEVRRDAIRCAKHACGLGQSVDKEDDPRRLLAFEFTQVCWIAALSRVLRSPSASSAERDAAYDALGAFVDDASHGSTRHFGSGGALTALIFALQLHSRGCSGSKYAQDTSEAGGRRHRLLQPFNDSSPRGSHSSTAAKARRLLGDILLLGSNSQAANLLHSAYPHVVDAVLN